MRDNRIANVGVGPLCKLFGKSRQAYYQKYYHTEEVNTQNMLVLDLVAAFRREIPGLGTNKLYRLIRPSLHLSEIKMGRDKLHSLLQAHNLIIRASRRAPKTTNSNHWMKKYPNLIKDLQIVTTEQVWVCDLTYICVGNDFNYLSLITDAHSRMIVGYCLHPFLNTEGCITALEMAIASRTKEGAANSLIHHSDRGSQYCSFQYVSKLRESGVNISMTDNGDPYENAMAERINGILKVDFKLNRLFKSHAEALLATKSAIANYNLLRPHMSCDYLTPQAAHLLDQPMRMHWKKKQGRQSVST
ncbi:IS3 family transposase [Pedobacter frigoris]|uniref:IS3 family transposase n=1 Tax=Pedobacter frigoris TaxID=2571272 RepID=UPI00292E9532|nr:IS3 family transposase [Pedobacter frigoris]